MNLDRIINYNLCANDQASFEELCRPAHSSFKSRGYAVFPQFLTQCAVDATLAQIDSLPYRKEQILSAYVDSDYPGENGTFEYSLKLGYIAGDNLKDNEVLNTLSQSGELLNLVKRTVGTNSLYRYNDPLASMSLARLVDGDYIGWHLDQTDFVVYIVLEKESGGGAHEIVLVKEAESYDFDSIKSTISDTSHKVETLPLDVGSLVVFDGRRLLHRITEVKGKKSVALFFYSPEEDTQASEELKKARFGRTN